MLEAAPRERARRPGVRVLTLCSLVLLTSSCTDPSPKKKPPAQPTEEVMGSKEPMLAPDAPSVRSAEDVTLPPIESWLGRGLQRSYLVEGVDGSQAFITIDDDTITLADMDAQLRAMPMPAVSHLGDPNGRVAFAEQTVGFELLAREGERLGLASSPKVMFAEIKALAGALRQKVVDGEFGQAPTTEEVQAYYAENAVRFNRAEERVAALITGPSLQDLEKLRENLLNEAPTATSARLELFEAAALAHSTHPSKIAAGRIPALPRTSKDLPEPVLDALFALSPNELSAVMPMGDEFVLVMLVSTRPAQNRPFAEVEEMLRTQLLRSRAPALFNTLKEGWLAKSTCEAHPEALDGVIAPPTPVDFPSTLAVQPGQEQAVVVACGETTLTLELAIAALETWPARAQGEVLNGQSRQAFVERLTELATIAEEARRQGLADSRFVRLARKRGIVEALEKTLAVTRDPDSISEEEARERYVANVEAYHRAERRRMVELVVGSEKEAQKLRAELLTQAPEPNQARADALRALSAKLSIDPQVKRMKGSLPYLSAEPEPELAVPERLRQEAFALERYALSAPIELDGKWALVLVDGIREGVTVPFEQASASIRHALALEPAKKARADLLASLTKAHRIETHPEVLAGMNLPDIRHDH